MKKLAVLILFLCASTQAMAADRCTALNSKKLTVNGNGFANGLTGAISLQGPTNGTYSFQTWIQFPNAPVDAVTGTCKDRHIVFTRTRPGSFVQEYDGWLFEWNDKLMAGVFDNQSSSSKRYGWYGELTPVPDIH